MQLAEGKDVDFEGQVLKGSEFKCRQEIDFGCDFWRYCRTGYRNKM